MKIFIAIIPIIFILSSCSIASGLAFVSVMSGHSHQSNYANGLTPHAERHIIERAKREFEYEQKMKQGKFNELPNF